MDKENEAAVSYQEYININVEILNEENLSERYTTYDIILKTNSISFSSPYSRVRRRYNDFLWLRQRLSRSCGMFSDVSVPSLSRRQFTFLNFESNILEKRRSLLQSFLRSVVKETIFMSSSALHLFLQTQMSPKQMDACIEDGGVSDAIAQHLSGMSGEKFIHSHSSDCISEEFSESSSENSDDGTSDDCTDGRCNNTKVLWKVEKNTMRRISSLPHFSQFLNAFEPMRAQDTNGDNQLPDLTENGLAITIPIKAE